MSVAIFSSLLVIILRHFLVVAAFVYEDEAVSMAQRLDHPAGRQLCSAGYPNTPCAEKDDVSLEMSNNATAFARVASLWNDRLRVEMTMLSMESHILFCSSPIIDFEFEHRVIAKAVVDMLTSVHTMQRTDEILTDVSLTAVEKNLQVSYCAGEKYYFLHRWFDLVNETMDKDSLLREEYAAKRVQATLDTPRPIREENWEKYFYPLDAVKDTLCNFTVFREAYVNRIFMEQAFNHRCCCQDTSDEDQERYILARALVELAQSLPNGYQRSLLNQMYKSALLEVALALTCDDESPLSEKEDQAKNELFAVLERLVKEESWLSSTLDTVFRHLKANDILLADRNSTV